MHRPSLSLAVVLLAGVALLSCDRRDPLAPQRSEGAALVTGGSRALVSGVPEVLISQIYGGGGNAGATLKNDFIELFNPGADPVALDGWSVQYASASGTSWQRTFLSGTIAAGGYYLVKEAAGSGGTVNLPTPDAAGGIPMSANYGKVWLVSDTAALSGSCPTASAVDRVSYGSTATDCGLGNTGLNLANATAALRKGGGCLYTGSLAADFAVAAPAPRNSASATHACPTGPVVTVTIFPGDTSLSMGAKQAFAAAGLNGSGDTISTTFTWGVGDTSIAVVNGIGVVTGRALGSTALWAISADGIGDTVTITVTPPVIRWLDVSSSADSFPPGFQTQVFVTARTGDGGLVVPASFTFLAQNPTVATVMPVDNTAIVTGVSASTSKPGIRVTATPIDIGTPPYTFTSYSVKIIKGVAAPVSIYGTNDEFGDPTAAGPSDPEDLLIVRPQYTLSYNETRGTPNWVSYELDARQFGSQDRCNCFTADPLLPADKQILTSDYTNGGYDRGHMTRSADRTAANLDNAATFYLTNIVPQMADLNQGPWSDFEMALGDSAKAGRAVYVITGPLYSRTHGLTFLKNAGKVAVPDSTWKIAFIGSVSSGVPFGRADLQTWGDLAGLTILAVSMPNVSGIKNVPWASYRTTVDRIEEATGYDFLSLLPVAFQTALEADDHSPVAAFTVGGPLIEGAPLPFDASSTTDPDIGRTDMAHAEALSYAWSFSDAATASGVTVSKAFAQGGTHTATLIVTDSWGWPSTATHTFEVLTRAQGIAALGDLIASLGPGSGPLATGEVTSLRVKLDAAAAAYRRGDRAASANMFGALANELQALVNSGRVAAGTAAPLIGYAERLIASL